MTPKRDLKEREKERKQERASEKDEGATIGEREREGRGEASGECRRRRVVGGQVHQSRCARSLSSLLVRFVTRAGTSWTRRAGPLYFFFLSLRITTHRQERREARLRVQLRGIAILSLSLSRKVRSRLENNTSSTAVPHDAELPPSCVAVIASIRPPRLWRADDLGAQTRITIGH